MDAQQSAGFVIWLTGMNRAGKSTLAAHLASRLAAAGRRVELLDEGGDAALLLEGLGPSKEDHGKAVGRLLDRAFQAEQTASRLADLVSSPHALDRVLVGDPVRVPVAVEEVHVPRLRLIFRVRISGRSMSRSSATGRAA